MNSVELIINIRELKDHLDKVKLQKNEIELELGRQLFQLKLLLKEQGFIEFQGTRYSFLDLSHVLEKLKQTKNKKTGTIRSTVTVW